MDTALSEIAVNLQDPFAWIVLRLPKRLWEKGQETLEDLTKSVDINLRTGEISTRPSRIGDERKVIEGSNIANILHHLVDRTVIKPSGFDEVLSILKEKTPTRAMSPLPPPLPPPRKSPEPVSQRSAPKRKVTSDKYRAQYIEKSKS